MLAWLLAPGLPLHEAVAADVDLSAASIGLLDEIVAAARRAGRPARVHLKVDTGLSRGGAPAADWPVLCEAAAKAAADGDIEIVGVWSHFVYADVLGHATTDRQLDAFRDGARRGRAYGISPPYRHIANSAATLTRPRRALRPGRPGHRRLRAVARCPGDDFGLRPAMTARARVLLTKRVPAGQGVSYGHTYRTDRETTLALVPLGYADGVPRAASNVGAGPAGRREPDDRRAGLHGPGRAGLR